MKKLITLILSSCIIFAISCSSGFDPELLSSTGESGGGIVEDSSSPADLIPINVNGSTDSKKKINAFIEKYDGSYYEGQKIQYLFIGWNGKIGAPQSETDNQVVYFLPQVVLPSANKLQVSNYTIGEIRVLNMTNEGLEAYTSYIIEKVSGEVLINNKGIGGKIPALAKYKGTYNSIAQDNKVQNYIAIDKNGNIYFHNSAVSILNGNANIKGGQLSIWEDYMQNGQRTHRKVVFKFDQGVYRRYGSDGNTDLDYKMCYTNRR